MLNLRRLDLSLIAVQFVGLATLVRSVMFDRWITVLAAALLLIGATAGRSGKSWGVALTLGAAAAFPVAFLIGIAPAWFCLVGAFGALPFLLASRSFAKLDKGATATLAAAALGVGGVAAMAWREVAWSVFTEIPLLRPSVYAQHGLSLLPLIGVVVYAMSLAHRRSKTPLVYGEPEATTQYRVVESSGVRVSDALSTEQQAMEELETELDAERPYSSNATARRASR